MKVITSGYPYLDIDAYGGMIAQVELLQQQGIDAIAASTAPLNESITPTVRSWQAPLARDYTPSPLDTFTLIDISDPKFFDRFVNLARVDEVIDHHTGFEEYWQDRIGSGASIEFVGAACSQVVEKWELAGLLAKISRMSARLLICGILDNTLNFGAQITTPKDTAAYEKLLPMADLPEDWTKQYFLECQQSILADAEAAIRGDTKLVPFKTILRPVSVGQLTVWDAEAVLTDHRQAMHDGLAADNPDWFMNLISVGNRQSYFVSDNPKIQAWLGELIGVEFTDSVATADRLWLRKEIIKADMEV
jgi:inorganic pyrophosphatase/exopolyphosphatase